MSDIVIRVENLYKEYRLGTISHGTLYRDLQSWWARMRGKEDPNSIIGTSQRAHCKASDSMPSTLSAMQENPHILVLNDVSFEVKRGDVLGIIGRNGAGKSTLLKILSEVTSPTKGTVKIKGRVASLLEVGTGFHPELTGRENIFLNGTILGMTKIEISSKFDEIVAFAEIEKFIDTPVKRYSSGMYVRLAFAVAAHLEPEILIVDEVLAVGDAQFQKKCLGKMGDVAKEGRTVLFVSHNMSAVSDLCNSAMWISSGQVQLIAEAANTVKAYFADNHAASGGKVIFDIENEKEAYIISVELRNRHGEISSIFDISSEIKVNIMFCCNRRFQSWRIYADVKRFDGITVFSTTTWDFRKERKAIVPGIYCAKLHIPARFLIENSYFLTVAFGEPPFKRHDIHENVLNFEVTGKAFDYGRNIGLLAYPFEWEIEPRENS